MNSTRFAGVIVAALGLTVLYALPALAPRAVVQDLFGILTLLVLAMNWNMLAGFAGLVSVGQQAFVGIGDDLKQLYQALQSRDLAAGSPAARRRSGRSRADRAR